VDVLTAAPGLLRTPQTHAADPTSVELAVTGYFVGLDEGQPPRRAPTFERSQNVVVERVDDQGERDDVTAIRRVRGKIKNGPDEVAVEPLCGLDVGRWGIGHLRISVPATSSPPSRSPVDT
jgi:hypothetical protein